MTDYYYQARHDDPPDEEGKDRRRPDPADEYPADRDFFQMRRDLIDLEAAMNDEPAGEEPPYDEGEDDRQDSGASLLPAVYDPDSAAYGDDDPYRPMGEAEDVGYEPNYSDAAAGYYPPEADGEALDPDELTDERWADPDAESEPHEVPYAPPAAVAGRVSVAEAGKQAARRIRFDPTQERGAGHYTAARRHSRLVRTLKFALPGIALIGILAFLGFVQFAPAPDDAVITLSGINVESESVTMETPHISGFDGTKRAYEVRATRAVQDLSNPKIVTMDDINARLRMDDGETAHLRAVTGTYNDETKKMVLSKGISLETTNGYKATLEDAQIDIAASFMTTSNPVTIVTDQATVKAHAMELKDNGKHIMFRDGVTVVFTPKEEEAAGGETPDGTAPAADAPATPVEATGGAT